MTLEHNPIERTVPTAGVVLALLVLGLVAAAAAVPDLIGGSPNDVDPTEAFRSPSFQHLFGTDWLGRDVFARVVHGARASLAIGIGGTALASFVGSVWGLAAGVGGRTVDTIAMRAADIVLSFPSILMALLIVTILGPGTVNVTFAIALALAPGFARIVRVQTQLVTRSSYVATARDLGVPSHRILLHHIAPNVLLSICALATMSVATAIMTGASLSFLGLGPQPPAPEWGSMLAQSRNYLGADWTLALFPGAAITITVMAVSIVGRSLQTRFEGNKGI